MAGINANISSGIVALVANTPKTVLQLRAPANQRLVVKSLTVSGTSAAGGLDVPVRIAFSRSTAAFGTGTSKSPSKKSNGDPETLQAAGFINFTVEPTVTTDMDTQFNVSPMTGATLIFPPSSPITVAGGTSWQVTSIATTACSITVSVDYEE